MAAGLDLASKPKPEALLQGLERNGQVATAQRLRNLHQAQAIEF